MIVRLGLPKSTGAFPGAAERLEAPVLISANSLWDQQRKKFRMPGEAICDLDAALDSAGFVAMSLYGCYRWTVEQYVELAGLHSWTWWAQMDICCEPELTGEDSDILARIFANGYFLAYCQKVARTWREEAGVFWLQDPMPVLQGWTPNDYLRCMDLYDQVLEHEWPDLVGVGSVCRRSVEGEDGVLNILEALDSHLPHHVKLHLFGVKGSALKHLEGHDRVLSTDSMAWDFRARRDAQDRGVKSTNEHRMEHMRRWYERQRR
jgi:hypothetical protein